MIPLPMVHRSNPSAVWSLSSAAGVNLGARHRCLFSSGSPISCAVGRPQAGRGARAGGGVLKKWLWNGRAQLPRAPALPLASCQAPLQTEQVEPRTGLRLTLALRRWRISLGARPGPPCVVADDIHNRKSHDYVPAMTNQTMDNQYLSTHEKRSTLTERLFI